MPLLVCSLTMDSSMSLCCRSSPGGAAPRRAPHSSTGDSWGLALIVFAGAVAILSCAGAVSSVFVGARFRALSRCSIGLRIVTALLLSALALGTQVGASTLSFLEE